MATTTYKLFNPGCECCGGSGSSGSSGSGSGSGSGSRSSGSSGSGSSGDSGNSGQSGGSSGGSSGSGQSGQSGASSGATGSIGSSGKTGSLGQSGSSGSSGSRSSGSSGSRSSGSSGSGSGSGSGSRSSGSSGRRSSGSSGSRSGSSSGSGGNCKCCPGVSLPYQLLVTIQTISPFECTNSFIITNTTNNCTGSWIGSGEVCPGCTGNGSISIDFKCSVASILPNRYILSISGCYTATGEVPTTSCSPYLASSGLFIVPCCSGASMRVIISE